MTEWTAAEALDATEVTVLEALDADFVAWYALSPYTAVEMVDEAAALNEDAADEYERYCFLARTTRCSRGPAGATMPCCTRKSRNWLSDQVSNAVSFKFWYWSLTASTCCDVQAVPEYQLA